MFNADKIIMTEFFNEQTLLYFYIMLVFSWYKTLSK